MNILKLLKPKTTYSQRVERLKQFTGKNKFFTLIALAVIIFLIANFLGSRMNQDAEPPPKKDASQAEITEEIPPENQWRFYFIDLWIVGIAGGFCGIMILREKRKAREKL